MLSVTSGPTIASGNTNPVQNAEPDQGPSLTFQGAGLTDPRYVANIGGAPGTKIYGLYANSYLVSTDALPVTLATNKIAAAQATTLNVPMTLASAQTAGVAPLIPVLPFGSPPIAASLVNTVALDFGFTVGNTASNKTLTIPAGAWRFFYSGQRICIAGANGASAAPLFTTVAAAVVPGTTTITLADAATATSSNCAIGSAHPTLNAVWPFVQAGQSITLFDPTQGICRAVSVVGIAGSTAGNYTVRGYDVWGVPMTEVLAFAGGATTVSGKKAFKHIVSVTPSVSSANSIAVGTLDVIGINFRADFWEYMDIFMAGSFVTASTGWTVADVSTPTGTTGDVRGTYALQTASNFDGTVANWPTSRRLAMFSSLPIFNSINATNLNFASLFGNTQFAG
jgi:hypothetical protein